MEMSTIRMAKNLSAALALEQKLTTELPTLMPDLSVLVNGTPKTCAQVVAQTEQHVNAEEHLLGLKAQVKEAQAAIKSLRREEQATLLAVKAAAAVAFGNTSASYQTLGFPSPTLRRTTTTAVKAEAVEKSHATREARGTKGSRQKASIHGTVPATTGAPATPVVVK
jgi:hypothetical protein